MECLKHTIAVDVMGSDLGPGEIIRGVVDSLKGLNSCGVILVGDRKIISDCLEKYGSGEISGIEICHASEVIEMGEKPICSLKSKKDSSILKAISLVRDGCAQVMLSCGNTGSLMAGSTLKLRQMEGVERPVLATVIPTLSNYIVMADVGANPNTTPIQMAHSAVLSSDYCSKILGIETPRVGLLTIGTEEGKGNEITLASHELLKKLDNLICYSGLIEGFHIFENTVDVVICDGFVGNILLKTLESLVVNLKQYTKDEMKKNPLRMLGAMMSKGVFDSLKNRLNPETYGAASLLGLNGIVFKSHGSSNYRSICNAMRMASSVSVGNSTEKCKEKIFLANKKIK